MNDKATFHASFDGASVTVKFDCSALGKRKNVAEMLKLEGDGKPSRKIFPQYVAWMHTVMCQVAQQTDRKILYAYPPRSGLGYDFYVYRPDGTYERTDPPR